MRGLKAKRIRKLVYGDGARRQEDHYVRLSSGVIKLHPDSLRAKYQIIKQRKLYVV